MYVEWMKKVEGAKWEAQRPADRSEAAHEERMVQLEKERMALAKSINDLEMAIQREESVYRQFLEHRMTIKRRTDELESEKSQIKENKLRVLWFRDMGLSWSLDDFKNTSSFESWKMTPLKCHILSRKTNNVFSLSFEPLNSSKSNPFEDARCLWEHLAK